MGQYRFKQVDVFTARPFYGNPVAVVLDADDVDPAEMQRIARWTNLSETTFVLRPTVAGADYRLRIFYPNGELPFAGHPTIGSAHAVMEHDPALRGTRKLVQECGAGLLPLSINEDGADREIHVQVPVPKVLHDCQASPELLSSALGAQVSRTVQPMAVDVGPVWLIACLDDLETVRSLDPDMAAIARLSRDLNVTGVTVFSLGSNNGAQVHVRSFAPAAGVVEDPVCGSGNASVGAFLAYTGMLKETGAKYSASQGTELGRDGRVDVLVEDRGRLVTIGGKAVTVVDGTIRL